MKTTFNKVKAGVQHLVWLALTVLLFLVAASCLFFWTWPIQLVGLLPLAICCWFLYQVYHSDLRCRSLTVEENRLLVHFRSGATKQFALPAEIKNVLVLDAAQHWIRVELSGDNGRFFFNSVHFDQPAEIDATFRKLAGKRELEQR